MSSSVIQRCIRWGLPLLLVGSFGFCWAAKVTADRAGGSDHSLIARYAGSLLYHYGEENYGAAPTLVLSKGKLVEETREGKITNKMYWGPVGRSPLEVFRNYQAALRNAGYETVYQCETEQCTQDGIQSKIVRWAQNAKWVDGGRSDFYVIRIFEYKPGFHYLHVKKQGPAGPVNIQLALRSGDEDRRDSEGRVQQFIQIIEATAMEQGMVDAKLIGSSLMREGRIALYGILFDTNRAVVKPESGSTLEQMAAALKNDPGLNVFIVGHTDNQGAVESNLALSRKRAQAVAELLKTRYGIAEGRLQHQGIANFAPVASNLTDDGRAKNRRVEMVLR